jgi:hypothetical protein
VPSVAETAARLGRSLAAVRRWIEDKAHPAAALPDEWKTDDDGSPAPNWVAALHRSRTGR